MEKRKCDVTLVPVLWYHVKELKKSGKNNHQNLLKAIKIKGLSDKNLEQNIRNAVLDGLLVETVGDGKKCSLYSLPVVERKKDVEPTGHDWYCYECHNVNDHELKICEGCKLRCFHSGCVSKNLLQDESIVNANKKRLSSFAAAAVAKVARTTNKSRNNSVDARSEAGNGSVVNDDTLNEALQHDIIISLDNGGDAVVENGGGGGVEVVGLESSLKVEFKKSNTSLSMKKEASPDDIKDNMKDVVFDKVVRDADPRSSRKTVATKPETVEAEEEMSEEEMLAKFCLNCRVLKTSTFGKPQTSTDIEEMNYLLHFLFTRVKTWVLEDMYTQSSLSAKKLAITSNVELIREKLVKIPTSMKVIAKKLHEKKYDQIDQIYCDLLDVSHNLAVIHGGKSAEHEASKFLLNDTLFEMSELKQCFDCYRHSNEKKDKQWFARPCVPRHELVYAKVQGFEYWPAKVIRIIDGQHDVRFFGAGHTRALIDPSFVKPIENPPSTLSGKLQKSIKELEKHQELLTYPVGTFSYATEKNNRESAKQTKKQSSPARKTPVATEPPKTPVNQTAAAKKKGDTLENPTSAKRARTGQKSVDKPHPTRPRASNGSPQVNGIEPMQMRSKSKSQEPVSSPASSPEKSVEMPARKKRKAKPVEEVRESPRKRGAKNVSESHSEAKSIPQQTEADSTLGSTLECFDLTSEIASHSDSDINSSMASDDAVLALENLFQTCKTVEEIKQASLVALQAQIQRNNQEISTLQEQHKQAITNAKTHEWCSSCENESRYYCCWNTTYCSKNCQQLHWQAGHKKMCRRKK